MESLAWMLLYGYIRAPILYTHNVLVIGIRDGLALSMDISSRLGALKMDAIIYPLNGVSNYCMSTHAVVFIVYYFK